MDSIIHGEAAEPMTAEKAAKLQTEYSQSSRLTDTTQKEFDKQQKEKSKQEKVVELIKVALDAINETSEEKEIKKAALGLLQGAQITVVNLNGGYVSRQALGNIQQIRTWFFAKGYNPNGFLYKQLEVPESNNFNDRVNHPPYYTWLKELCGIEVIDITRHMDFDLGNAIKYILRQGHKSEQGMSDKEKAIEDLKKAVFYLNDKIKMLER
jgi:hypothetical protein